MPSVRFVNVVFVKRNWMQLQLALSWFTPRQSRGGLQVEINPLGCGHLPSYNLAEDALNRYLFRDRVQMVSHCKFLSSCGGLDSWCLVPIWPSSFAPYHNLAMCAQHLRSPHAV